MSIHEVKVGERIREKTPSGKDRGVTSASIIVKPPITPGEYFNSAIRGRNPDGISLHHIVTTSEVTILKLHQVWKTLKGETLLYPPLQIVLSGLLIILRK